MAYTTINKHTAHFNTKLYTGNGADNNAITGVGFQPDMVWLKNRSTTDSHYLQDAVRTATKNLKVDATDAEETRADSLKSFNSDGFTLGTESAINGNGNNLASWNWKAGTTSIPSGSTSDPSAVSINTTSGFGIYKITAPGSGNYVLNHGLSATPAMVIVKRTDGTQKWMVWHKTFSNATDDYLQLNSNAAKATYSTCWGTMNTTDCTIATGGTLDTSAEHIIYVFTEKTGYSKFGKFIGNGSTDGPFIYTGFKPSFVIAKESSSTGHWRMRDNKRMTSGNPIDKLLRPDQTNAEQTEDNVDFLSNGFKMRTTGGENNGSGDTYIYMAFGQTIVGTNNVPTTAR